MAGFLDPLLLDVVLGFEPAALELVMLIALLGRTNGIGLAAPGLEEGVIGLPSIELGC